MTKLKHPRFKDFFIEVDDETVADHLAAGWLEDKPKRKAKEPETPSTDDGEE